MTCLVLSPRSTRDNMVLEQAAREASWEVFRAFRYQVPALGWACPHVYGDMPFCDAIAEQLGLGLFETPNDWLPTLPECYRHREVRLIEHWQLPSEVTERSFIKPANDKVFTAGVFYHGRHVPYRGIAPSHQVLVSEVVEFEVEVRCYVLNHKVLTAAIYDGNSRVETLTKHEEAEFVETAIAWTDLFLSDPEVRVPPAIVVDVGYIPDRGWAVIEANQAYASGIYSGGFSSRTGGAEPKQVLKVLASASMPLSQIDQAHSRWVRPQRDQRSSGMSGAVK